jgi:small subunit ribosomal protein S8
VYVGSEEIPKVLGGYGVNIVSTSKGLMSGKAARAANVGGEILAQVY